MEKLKPIIIALAAVGLAWAAVTAMFPEPTVDRAASHPAPALAAKKAALAKPVRAPAALPARRNPVEILADEEASDTAIAKAELRAGPEKARPMARPGLKAPSEGVVPLQPIRGSLDGVDAQ